RQGRATQKNTANGGDASKAIDGNTSGRFADGGQSHTEEGTRNPWWEVDLGQEVPIDTVVVYNRTDGALGKRLDGFTLQVLADAHRVIFQKANLRGPAVKAAYEVGAESLQGAIRRAAMVALTSVRGQEAATFKTLARLVRNGTDRPAAVQALLRIPVNQ